MTYKILIIDDEYLIRLSLREGLGDLGHQVETADSIEEGLLLIERFAPHFVLLDNRMGEQRGIDYIEAIKRIDDDIQIVLMTAYGSVSQAVEAVKRGAYDYILKPFDLDALDLMICRCMDQLKTKRNLGLISTPKYALVGESAAIENIRRQIGVVSHSDVDVLIKGETGTGKEVVANLIHHNSARGPLAMVKINCGAIPENLLESELFGYERGAFTGAAKTKKGLLELANGGTVFLDEIGELPLAMQSKLLTFLEDRRFKRVGGLNDIEVNVRVIAATNRDLRQAIARKEFREDLFYRLNVMQIAIPPLRERPEDILPLCNHFLAHFNRKFNKAIEGLDPRFAEELAEYAWKGNVRELRNVLERCTLFCEDRLLGRAAFLEAPFPPQRQAQADLDQPQSGIAGLSDFGEEGISLPRLLERIERECIDRALKISGNNHSKAAALLGITRFTLRRKLEQRGE